MTIQIKLDTIPPVAGEPVFTPITGSLHHPNYSASVIVTAISTRNMLYCWRGNSFDNIGTMLRGLADAEALETIKDEQNIPQANNSVLPQSEDTTGEEKGG